MTISCRVASQEKKNPLGRAPPTHLQSPPVTAENLRPLPPAPSPPPVPKEVWASHPQPNSHTASAGPSERKAVPAPPRTTGRPQSPPARPAAAPSSPATGSGREQVQEEMPQQLLLHPSRHRPPSCRSRRLRELGGEKGRKPGVGNPGIVADLNLAPVKSEFQGTPTKENLAGGGASQDWGYLSFEGREGVTSGTYSGGTGLRCDLGVKCFCFHTSEGHLSPYSWGWKSHQLFQGPSSASPFGLGCHGDHWYRESLTVAIAIWSDGAQVSGVIETRSQCLINEWGK